MSGLVSAASLIAPAARADGFAEPPGHDRQVVIATDGSTTRSIEEFGPEPRLSAVRIFVGPAGKFDADRPLPGMIVGLDMGRGPAGGRLSAAWLDVGAERGLAMYTGELTLDFGGRSRFRPVLGAGGGVARTSSILRADRTLDTSAGATMGIGVLRGGLGFRLPLDEVDARAQLDVTGALPAIRGASSPQTSPWVMSSLTVAIGF